MPMVSDDYQDFMRGRFNEYIVWLRNNAEWLDGFQLFRHPNIIQGMRDMASELQTMLEHFDQC